MENTIYKVVDSRTGQVVGTFKNRKRATRMADRKDLEYGAIRYRVEVVYQ